MPWDKGHIKQINNTMKEPSNSHMGNSFVHSAWGVEHIEESTNWQKHEENVVHIPK